MLVLFGLLRTSTGDSFGCALVPRLSCVAFDVMKWFMVDAIVGLDIFAVPPDFSAPQEMEILKLPGATPVSATSRAEAAAVNTDVGEPPGMLLRFTSFGLTFN